MYLAHDREFYRDVAIKVLHRHLRHDRTRFEQECRAAGRVSAHPNIVTVHEHGYTDNDEPYLTMRYCPGGSIADWLHPDHALEIPMVVALGLQIADALDHAHKLRVRNRDVKPENTLLTERGVRCLADFGIAKLTTHTASLTGCTAFTPSDVEPEVRAGGGVDASDRYSRGLP